MAFKIDGFVALTGGGTGALDKISVADKVTNDAALGVVSSVFYVYRYNSASSAAEDSPNVIAPDSGSGRWELVSMVDVDASLTANADNRTASQKAIKAYINGLISDTAYAASWDGVTDIAPSKNAVYDEVELINYEGIRKNYIINGNFDLWNYGTSQTTSGSFSADRWLSSHVAITSKTASQQAFALGQTDVPGEPVWFMRQEVTTASAANEYCILTQRVYGVNILAGKTVTLSFYAKADAVKNISIEFYQNFGTGGSASVTAIGVDKFGLTTNWARYTVTADITSISGKTVGPLSYLEVVFWFTCGSDRAARTDSLGNQSGTFDIANVALVEGADIAPLVKSVSEEQALCSVDDTAYGTSWDGVTNVAPSKNAVYDQMELRAPKASPTFTGNVTADNFIGIHETTYLKSLSAETIAYLGAGGPQVLGVGSGAAMLAFHRPGLYAVNFGLDTDNVLKVGGWSMGGVAKKILTADDVSDTAYGSGWNGVTDVAPSKNAVYDKVELLAPKLSPVFTASAASEATLGDNLVTNGDFATNDLTGWTAAAGWSAATGKAVHTAGIADTTPLVQTINLTNALMYMVEVTVSGQTAGSIVISFGSLEGSLEVFTYITGKVSFTATSTASFNLTITPTADFDGAVDDILVREITANTTPILDINDSTPTSVMPFRANASLFNTGIGYQVLSNNVAGYCNTALGYRALATAPIAKFCTAIGYNALRYNTTGYFNVALGSETLAKNTIGFNNTAIGHAALYENTTGSLNIGIGASAGRYYGAGTGANVTSSYSTYIGAFTRASADGVQNECAIGYNAVGNGSNTVTLGNTSVIGWYMGATKLIGVQGAAVADATGAGDVVAQLNALLARIRAHGLIAT